jgi:hypothetical protein
MSGTETQWEQEKTEITFVYFRYYGNRDENGERIYERQEAVYECRRSLDMFESSCMAHSEIKNHFIWMINDEMICEWQDL